MSIYEASITNPKKQLEFYKDLSEQLQQENKQLQERIEYLERSNNRREDTILEQRQRLSDLEDNWNKLRKWIVYNKHNENTEQHYLVVDYGTLLGKMQELEQGSDSNE